MSEMNDRQYWFWLDSINGIGSVKKQKIIDYFGDAREAYNAKASSYEQLKWLNKKQIDEILFKKNAEVVLNNYDKMLRKDIDMLLRIDSNYPNKLRNIYDPPFALYVKGRVPDNSRPTIAIVGARNCTNYGKQMAEIFSNGLSKVGFSIISGLALGIDTYAHNGAIKAGKATYAVLGCGVDICYPKENIDLFLKMTNNGGILSEFAPEQMPINWHFPMRNRIISGLSDGILVIEARHKSGSLITVDMGLEQGKNIYALPGRIDDKLSDGCNNLIKMGATIVTDINDIICDFSGFFLEKNGTINIEENSEKIIKNKILLESTQKIVYACLRLEPKHIEDIILDTGLGLTDTIQVLFELEEMRLVVQTTNNYYARLNDIW